ncbi:exosome complex RNA-binding protein Csl4 [Candidatus Micrarchaeota archaeon]|nr:exosome complex RNA-binding protein Csl4 [Candidatus Micrarchaeota archaeon]
MDKKKLVLPGDYLSSAEEAEEGRNTYMENDTIFSATIGEANITNGCAMVNVTDKGLVSPHIGMQVYGLIIRTSLNKAIAVCMPVKEAEGEIRSIEFEAVLPVTEIRKGYVKDIRDEVKMGDIIKAKINKITETDIELTIIWPEYGLVSVFCPCCRTKMDLKTNIFICGQCNWKERRKIPFEK